LSLTSRSRSRSLGTLLLLALGAPWLSGCEDDITCVFTTGCSDDGSGGTLGAAASLPENGLWILDSRPTITSVLPDGTSGPETTPVVVVFSESMNVESLAGVIEIVPDLGGLPGQALPGVPQTLTGDGRVLVLLPPSLAEGDYTVQVGVDSMATDITGQELDATQGVALASFAVVAAAAGDPPLVLTTWPPDNAQNQSDTSEIVAIFDRPVAPLSVSNASFLVLVNGLPPAENPLPQPLQIGALGASIPDPRGFVYRSADANGVFAPLGSGANVTVTLSPLGPPPITDPDGEPLAEFPFSFVTAPFATPLSAAIVSMPTDAIGIPNLTAGDIEELLIQVELLDAEPGDALDLFMFGTATTVAPAPLIAFRRAITLSGAAPIMTAQFTLDDIDLLSSSSPTSTRLADGPVAFAFRLGRGSAISTLQVMDVDPTTFALEDAELDTTAPVVSELLLPGGSTASFFSDLRDVTLVGRANEPLRAVDVTTAMGNNGVRAAVVGSTPDGLFIAAPVTLGLLPGGTIDYTLVAYDAAFNRSQLVTGTFFQRGAVHAGGFTPGDTVDIEVFDALTLEPISGALVLLHDDLGDGMTYPLSDSAATPVDGRVTLSSNLGGGGAVGAIVTVDAMGYDLFSFFDITSTDISIPLVLEGSGATAVAGGSVVTVDPFAVLTLPSLTSKLDDSRRSPEAPRTYDAQPCSGVSVVSCPFGPEPIRPARLGVQSFVAGDFMLTEPMFNAIQLLRAFCLELPLEPAAGLQDTSFELPFMLNDPAIAPEEIPVELFPGTQVTFRADATAEIDLAFLVGDPTTLGDPRITVETIVPGVAGTVVVGMGLAYDLGAGDMWTVRAAAPGAVTPGGFFGMTGSVDTDLFTRFELRDSTGRVAGARVREANLASLPMPNMVFATSPSVLLAPLPGGNSGGQSYNVDFQDVIPDLAGEEGLYRVELEDDAGRRWVVWTPDPPGSGTVSVHLPDIVGGAGLLDGSIDCQIEAFAWPSLSTQEFLWSDVEREHDLFSFSEPFSFDQP
jgi:hypothetical protein